jgi:hypothetical protein
MVIAGIDARLDDLFPISVGFWWLQARVSTYRAIILHQAANAATQFIFFGYVSVDFVRHYESCSSVESPP